MSRGSQDSLVRENSTGGIRKWEDVWGEVTGQLQRPVGSTALTTSVLPGDSERFHPGGTQAPDPLHPILTSSLGARKTLR